MRKIKNRTVLPSSLFMFQLSCQGPRAGTKQAMLGDGTLVHGIVAASSQSEAKRRIADVVQEFLKEFEGVSTVGVPQQMTNAQIVTPPFPFDARYVAAAKRGLPAVAMMATQGGALFVDGEELTMSELESQVKSGAVRGVEI